MQLIRETERVVLILIALACAAIMSRLLGGRLAALGKYRFHSVGLLIAAAITQVVGYGCIRAGVPASPTNVISTVITGVLVMPFCLRNKAIPGFGLIAVGTLIKVIVISANGAMPISAHAAIRAGVNLDDATANGRQIVATSKTQFRKFGDTIPFPAPFHQEVIGISDLLITAGLAQLVGVGMLQHRRSKKATAVTDDKTPSNVVSITKQPATIRRFERLGRVDHDSDKPELESKLLRVITRPSAHKTGKHSASSGN